MKERLLQLVKALNLSGRAFAASIGKSETWLTTMTGVIRSDVLTNILVKYPKVNLRWLLLGEGDIFISEEEIISETSKDYKSLYKEVHSFNEEVRSFNEDIRKENKEFRKTIMNQMSQIQTLTLENTNLRIRLKSVE
jgi:hypothetical protein